MATWEDCCPVEGQCSECGLEFDWREVLVDRERWNARHIEHCPRSAIPVATIRTVLWSVLPWVFWKKVQLKHEPRVGRMVLWLAIVLLGAHLLASAATAVAISRVDHRRASFANANRTMQLAQMTAARSQVAQLVESPETERLLKQIDAQIAELSKPFPENVLRLDHLTIAFGAPVLYIRDDSNRLNRTLRAWNPFPATNANGWVVGILRFWHQRAFLVGATLSLSYLLLILILPATRRRLRIRRAHVARAAIFGAAWLLLPALLRLAESIAVIVRELSTNSARWAIPDTPLSQTWQADWAMWSWVLLAWISAWWLCALWRGFRFPRPIFHWSLLTAAAGLLSLIVLLSLTNLTRFEAFVAWEEWLESGRPSRPQVLAEGNVRILR